MEIKDCAVFSLEKEDKKDDDLLIAVFPNEESDDGFVISLKELCLFEIRSSKIFDGTMEKEDILELEGVSRKLKLLAKIIDDEIEKKL